MNKLYVKEVKNCANLRTVVVYFDYCRLSEKVIKDIAEIPAWCSLENANK